MIKELGELNEKFYELYGRLYENGELLTPKQAALMADNLLAQYKAEYELLALKTGIEEAKELYTVKQRRGTLIPHRWRFLFWRKENYAAQVIDREIQTEITRYFNERERALARLVEAIEKENAEALNESNEEANELTDEEAPGAAETPAEENQPATPENEEANETPDEPTDEETPGAAETPAEESQPATQDNEATPEETEKPGAGTGAP